MTYFIAPDKLLSVHVLIMTIHFRCTGVTGNVLASDVEEFIQHGADLVLGKPLKLAMLKEAIENYLIHGGRGAEGAGGGGGGGRKFSAYGTPTRIMRKASGEVLPQGAL
jgi:hypothetical protein